MEEGPLLPKLRGYFAEFLREVSLARLSALTLTHLCRFAVRASQTCYETFLGNLSTDALRGFPLSSTFDCLVDVFRCVIS